MNNLDEEVARLQDKIRTSLVNNKPFDHVVIDNFFSDEVSEKIYSDLMVVENLNPDNIFKSNNGCKKEYKSKIPNLFYFNFLLDIFSSQNLNTQIKSLLNTDELFSDATFEGGGYVISPSNSFLRYHCDFNYSKNVKMYRAVNLILYLNKDYSSSYGGNLHLLDNESRTVEKIVEPKFNRIAIFKTSEATPHGVSKNNENFQRRSFNCYFYSKQPIIKNNGDIHKTIWL